MNPEVKAKWVAALRSGQYRQGRGQLRTGDDAFCCLGVLCNIHAQTHPKYAAKQNLKDRYGGIGGVPPGEVTEWAGLDELGDIWRRNDGVCGHKKHNFQEIADYIEREL